MIRKLNLFVLVLTLVFSLRALPAQAAGREYWQGRDLNNSNIFWTCSNTYGDHWVLKKNGTVVLEYDTVASNAEYIELQASRIGEFERVRLYNDKLMVNKPGSRFNWMEMAKGKWR
jgi:hypothetical protein